MKERIAERGGEENDWKRWYTEREELYIGRKKV